MFKRKGKIITTVLCFTVGYLYQFVIYGLETSWFFFPLKFSCIMLSISCYIAASLKHDNFTRLRFSILIGIIVIPISLIYLGIIQKYKSLGIDINWIWGFLRR